MAVILTHAMDFDDILAKCGNSHRYQYLLLGLYSLLMFITSMHYFSQNVISFVPDHWCYHEQLENRSFEQVAAIYNQFERPSCTRLESIDSEGLNATVSEERCDRWIYNYDFGFRSMNTDLDWVCDAAYKPRVGQSFFFVGSLFGTLIFGLLGDKIGRIKALILANWCGFLGDFTTIFAGSLTTFSITRFVSGLAVDTNTYLMYILVLEYTTPAIRNWGLSVSMGVFYCLGMICSSGLAILVGSWRLFLMCSSLSLLLVTLFYFLTQESAQWLVTRNDIDGAVLRLQRVAKVNRRHLNDEDINAFRSYCQINCHNKAQQGNDNQDKLMDMFKTPHLRKVLIQMLIVFTIVCICFNTMARSVEGLGISPLIMFALTALTLFPSGLLQADLQKRIGRKGSAVLSMLLTGVLTAASGIALSLWQQPGVVLLVCLTMASRLGMSVCLGSTLLFSTELVPTCVRSRGLAVAHMAGAAASLLTPYIQHVGIYYKALPSIIMCLLFFICAYISLRLPETGNRKLPITLAEGELFGRGERMFDFIRNRTRPQTTADVDDKLEAETEQKFIS
ncbi:steroid transmembrane transporter SLC22A24 [Drosophila grimshawi]|uniref:GH14229 n=1 Tax=Drosophila grimshawi TaxID=7222 RepID=B4JY49_DROGR|nr:steroid transmembrane transporter SLC22A24 [Drosophila grimshawi]EDV90611.1 GH14229 [Drosophila grimshawi]